MTINDREFNISTTPENGLVLTYLDKQLEREYVLIKDGSDRWTTQDVISRLERYSTMPLNEMRHMAWEVL
jgi:hypothetical protein